MIIKGCITEVNEDGEKIIIYIQSNNSGLIAEAKNKLKYHIIKCFLSGDLAKYKINKDKQLKWIKYD